MSSYTWGQDGSVLSLPTISKGMAKSSSVFQGDSQECQDGMVTIGQSQFTFFFQPLCGRGVECVDSTRSDPGEGQENGKEHIGRCPSGESRRFDLLNFLSGARDSPRHCQHLPDGP